MDASDARIFQAVALLAILFWLLPRVVRLTPVQRRWFYRAAFGILGVGLALALLQTVLWGFAET
ncbi:hypothetical protein [Marinivivus vitaminiproducens]|uniref:hypothetical protein n=1 Tax=Marinivivus vitaminiproducens TaxID=3035935 RepID=UPI0027A87256|nr:hypothetical protein P4R82_17270 [Geminicoccaceae bacterium SCSIO 64248]